MESPHAHALAPRRSLWRLRDRLARIIHPNVVRVRDAGAYGDRVWLALELCEGETLGQKIRAGARPPLEDLLDWIQQVCEGLAEAHRMEVVHRDLTPDNIVVMRDGRAKIIDMARASERSAALRARRKDRPGGSRR
jgi:serine/threonine protein kinase